MILCNLFYNKMMSLQFIDDVDSPQFGVKRPDNRNPVSNRVVPTTTTERPGETDDYSFYSIIYIIILK